MICNICCDLQATTREKQEPRGACDLCLAAIGDIRIWLRESGKQDSMELTKQLRVMDVNYGKARMR